MRQLEDSSPATSKAVRRDEGDLAEAHGLLLSEQIDAPTPDQR